MFLQGKVQLQNNGDRTGMFEVFQIRGKLRPNIVFLPFPTNTTNCNNVDVIDLFYLTGVIMDKVLLRYTAYVNC